MTTTTQQKFTRIIAAKHYTNLTPTDHMIYATRVTLECEYGHQWTTSVDSILTESGCPICGVWAALQKRVYKNIFTRERALYNFSQKHGIPYQIPKKFPAFASRAHACQVVLCHPAQAYLREFLIAHHLPWEPDALVACLIALEKWRFQTYPDLMMGHHKETMAAVLVYQWGQWTRLKYSQATVCAWGGIAPVTLRNWVRRFQPFFKAYLKYNSVSIK